MVVPLRAIERANAALEELMRKRMRILLPIKLYGIRV